jgi:hypothetical protein
MEFDELIKPCIDVSCVISSLAGLREVVIDAQKKIIRCSHCSWRSSIYTSGYFQYGENQNLDFRREFHEYLDQTSISATSIFNGAFLNC